MKASKNELRKLMRRTLRGLPVEEIINTSEICQRKVLESTDYLNSRGICCYLSMINELQTKKIIETALSDSKKVYIPKIIGPNPQDMQIHEIYSMEQVDSFPKSSWGIPEPPDEHTCSLDYAEYIDVIYLPGVAFDRNCNRLGHGKAYYGKLWIPNLAE